MVLDINLISGYSFLLLGILVVVRNIRYKRYYDLFWFCDFSLFLFAIGFITNNLQIIKSIINIGLISQVATFIGLLIYHSNELSSSAGRRAFMKKKFYSTIELLIHITVIYALVITYNVAPMAKSLIYSMIIIVAMLIGTRLFTPIKENVNAVYSTKVPFGSKSVTFNLPLNAYLWMVYLFILSLLSFLIQYLIYIYTS